MDTVWQAIAAKRERLDKLRPLPPEALAKLEHYYDIELTYTSNAIEGNTLSPVETALVIEQGVTIGGKPLKDHLEALDHYDAIRYVREIARRQSPPLTEVAVRNLHGLIVKRSRPDIAGRYADLARYVRTETGRHMFPSPAEIPALMGDFAAWLKTAPDTPPTAFQAHRRLVDIHPFNDGTGPGTSRPCSKLRQARERTALTPCSTSASTRPWEIIWASSKRRCRRRPEPIKQADPARSRDAVVRQFRGPLTRHCPLRNGRARGPHNHIPHLPAAEIVDQPLVPVRSQIAGPYDVRYVDVRFVVDPFGMTRIVRQVFHDRQVPSGKRGQLFGHRGARPGIVVPDVADHRGGN
jgi:hypothetical protein